jgi:hypothetical protein
MKEHPGHFWICLWLFFICMHSCAIRDDVKQIRENAAKTNTTTSTHDNGSGVSQ